MENKKRKLSGLILTGSALAGMANTAATTTSAGFIDFTKKVGSGLKSAVMKHPAISFAVLGVTTLACGVYFVAKRTIRQKQKEDVDQNSPKYKLGNKLKKIGESIEKKKEKDKFNENSKLLIECLEKSGLTDSFEDICEKNKNKNQDGLLYLLKSGNFCKDIAEKLGQLVVNYTGFQKLLFDNNEFDENMGERLITFISNLIINKDLKDKKDNLITFFESIDQHGLKTFSKLIKSSANNALWTIAYLFSKESTLTKNFALLLNKFVDYKKEENSVLINLKLRIFSYFINKTCYSEGNGDEKDKKEEDENEGRAGFTFVLEQKYLDNDFFEGFSKLFSLGDFNKVCDEFIEMFKFNKKFSESKIKGFVSLIKCVKQEKKFNENFCDILKKCQVYKAFEPFFIFDYFDENLSRGFFKILDNDKFNSHKFLRLIIGINGTYNNAGIGFRSLLYYVNTLKNGEKILNNFLDFINDEKFEGVALVNFFKIIEEFSSVDRDKNKNFSIFLSSKDLDVKKFIGKLSDKKFDSENFAKDLKQEDFNAEQCISKNGLKKEVQEIKK